MTLTNDIVCELSVGIKLRASQHRPFVEEQPVHKEIDMVKNSHKWTRYAVLSVVVAMAPLASALTSAASSSPLGTVAATGSSGTFVAAAPSVPSPCSNKWT